MSARAVVVLAMYVGTVAVANWLTARYGFVPVGFGLAATAGTYAAGLALAVRDLLQEVGGRRLVLIGVVLGAALSAVTSSPALAIASGTAFLVSEMVDYAVYTPLRERGRIRALIASNLVGSLVDSVLFLALAGFPIWSAVPGQMVGKAWATAAAVGLVVIARCFTSVRRRRSQSVTP